MVKGLALGYERPPETSSASSAATRAQGLHLSQPMPASKFVQWLGPRSPQNRWLPPGRLARALVSAGELLPVASRCAILRTVMVVSGWRALIWLLAGLVVLALLLTFVVWLAALVGVIAAVAWLNLLLLPRISTRLRVPHLVVAVGLLPLLAASGLMLGGPSGLVAGSSAWLIGVALPQALLRRLRARLGRASGRAPINGLWLVPLREMSLGLRRPG